MPQLTQLIMASRWSQGLTASQIEFVRASMIERVVPAGGNVVRKGEPVDHWIGVIEGIVKVHSVSADGKPMTFTGVPQGGWIGEGSMLKTEARRYDIVAMRKSRIALMPRATFNWLLDTSIGFNRFLLEQINERLGQFLALIEFERLLKPDAKIARCIASLFNPVLYPSSGLQLKISQEEIGFLAGISRQRVNQALQVLAAEKMLRVEYGGITVLNLDGLKNY